MPFWCGIASVAILALWIVLGKDGWITRRDLLFPLGAAIAIFGVSVSSHRRWHHLAWTLVPLVLHGFVFAGFLFAHMWSTWRPWFSGPQFGSDGPHSGWDAMWVGDVDGDGTDDIALSTPFEPTPHDGWGVVRLISGRDGKTLRAIRGPHFMRWGQVVPAGDVDGDGSNDLLVHHRSRNESRVFSAMRGDPVLVIEDFWGHSMSAAGDIDGDGHGDLLVAHPLTDGEGKSRGRVRVVSGKDGSTLRAHEGTVDWEELGWSVCSPGDVDRDGTPDYTVSSAMDVPGESESRVPARMYSGRTGEVLWEHWERPPSVGGLELTVAGDMDLDGAADIFLNRWVWEDSAYWVLSGRDGRVIRSQAPSGLAVSSVGDLDADGCPDVQIEPDSVVGGRDGRRLLRVPGISLGSGAGDLDRDGLPELIRISNVRGEQGEELTALGIERISKAGIVEITSGLGGVVLMRIDRRSLEPLR